MAIIMSRAPEIMTIVSISFSRRKEIAVAINISVRSRIVDVEAVMCFKPSSHK
jgi:hypothetical protein